MVETWVTRINTNAKTSSVTTEMAVTMQQVIVVKVTRIATRRVTMVRSTVIIGITSLITPQWKQWTKITLA